MARSTSSDPTLKLAIYPKTHMAVAGRILTSGSKEEEEEQTCQLVSVGRPLICIR